MTKRKEKLPHGRPRKLQSPEQLKALTDEYLALCKSEDRPVTLTGALNFMGIYSRATLDEYEYRYEGFSEPCKRLRGLVAQAYEERLHGNSPTGAIFALKNMGWSDKQEHELSGAGGGPIVFETIYETKPE